MQELIELLRGSGEITAKGLRQIARSVSMPGGYVTVYDQRPARGWRST